MSLNVVAVHQKEHRGRTFNVAEVRGTPADHASVFSFEDEREVRDRWWHPGPGETVLDIGAAFGSYGIPALAHGARVVFFSPADFDTELLAHNLSLNPDLAQRSLVLRDGLYSGDGFFDPDHCKFVGAGESFGFQADPPWLIVRSLDSVLEERPGIARVDWMKLDVEGAELEVLRGAETCILMYQPKIIVENHEFQIAGIGEQVRDYLVGLGIGYTCEGPVQHHAVSHSFFSVK